ncbi:MAG: acyltransferase, partial [Proteobacteria bacterium]|nr:acyltransferase [Pseudomonadota bacterium]
MNWGGLFMMGTYVAKFFDLPALLKCRLRFRGASCGRGVRLRGRLVLNNQGELKIGDGVSFHSGPSGCEITVQAAAKMSIGARTMINSGCIFNASQNLEIGADCLFGYGVVVLDSDLHELAPSQRHLRPVPRPVSIGDDVWIGSRAIILAGVNIGRGSVVAEGSLVNQNVPPFTM